MKDDCEDIDPGRIKNLSENTDFTATLFESLSATPSSPRISTATSSPITKGPGKSTATTRKRFSANTTSKSSSRPISSKPAISSRPSTSSLATGRFSYEGEKVRKDGERFPAQILFTLTKDKTGKVVGFVEIVEDLTERKRAEEEMRIHRDQLARANEELRLENAERNGPRRNCRRRRRPPRPPTAPRASSWPT